MRGKVIGIVLCCLVGLVLLYGGVCCGITFIPMLRMNKVNEAACGDGSVHVGIDNVKTRLSYFGDTLEVSSKIGEGTTATIKVPKRRTILNGW